MEVSVEVCRGEIQLAGLEMHLGSQSNHEPEDGWAGGGRVRVVQCVLPAAVKDETGFDFGDAVGVFGVLAFVFVHKLEEWEVSHVIGWEDVLGDAEGLENAVGVAFFFFRINVVLGPWGFPSLALVAGFGVLYVNVGEWGWGCGARCGAVSAEGGGFLGIVGIRE